MQKKMHPVDIRDRERLAGAVSYNVHQRRGPHVKINEPATTLRDAASIADRISAEHHGRPCMIYGILPDSTAVLVPVDMVAAARGAPAPAVNLSRSEIERLSASLAGGSKKRANTKDSAVQRFRSIARSKGITDKCIAELLDGTYDAASRRLCDLMIDPTAEPTTAIEAPVESPAPAPEPAKSDKPATGKRAAKIEAAQRGELPSAPDFSAETHRRYRSKLSSIVALVEAGDVDQLEAIVINPISSSPQAMKRYRDLAVIALKARQEKTILY